jgi:hypothetical protein
MDVLMGDLPAPLTPPDLDLRDFRWMKLDLAALFNSDFNTTVDDAARRAGVGVGVPRRFPVAPSLPPNRAFIARAHHPDGVRNA